MRRGDKVTYTDAAGQRHECTITAVSDTGASGYKILDLASPSGAVNVVLHGVVHAKDKVEAQGYWQLVGEASAEPIREDVPLVVTDTLDGPEPWRKTRKAVR